MVHAAASPAAIVTVTMKTSMRVSALLLACMLLTAAIAIAGTAPSGDPKAALAMIAKLGGTAVVDDSLPGAPVVKVDLHESAVTDAELALLAALPELRHLDLRKTKVTDAGVAHLQSLRELRFLNLFRTSVSDAGLASLGELKQLETLLIGGTKVTSSGLAALKPHRHLRKLSVFDTAVDDTAIEDLRTLSSLRILLVGRSKITPEGMQQLQRTNPELQFTEM